MLGLSRRAGERIILTLGSGQTITLTYLGMRNGQGRIGIEAPDSVRILREELLDDDQREKARA
jgi:carbon storage regulator CsrA